MKTTTKLAYASILVSMMSGTMNAKDLYIAANGNDSNSGIAASAPRATLTGLNSIIEEGDVIHVSGMIDLTKEIALTDGVKDKSQTWGHWFTTADGKQTGFYINGSNSPEGSPWKNITIEGSDPTSDGFDGKEATRLFYVRGDNSKMTVKFKNLSLVNGLCPGEGAGAIFIHDNGFVEVENCIFDNHHLDFTVLTPEDKDGTTILKNPSSERGGAILFQTGRLSIKDSEFTNNKNRRGGAICANGGTLTVTNTNFSYNGAADLADFPGAYLDNTRGGAVCLWPLNDQLHATFDHCNFIENTVWNMAGGVYLYNNTDGGNLLDALFTNCAFIGNESIDGNAGAIHINNGENLGSKDDKCKNIIATFANCSVFNNHAKNQAGGIFLLGGLRGDVLRMVNCTVANNTTDGNAGHGAGFTEEAQNTFTPEDVDRYFYNCLFEYNNAPSASAGAGEYCDMTTRLAYQNIDASHFGRIVYLGGNSDDFLAALNNGAGYETLTFNTSVGNFGSEENTFVIPEENLSYYDYSNGNLPFIALNEGAEEFNRGNLAHLSLSESTITASNGKEFNVQGYDISKTDQVGFARPEGKCTIGAIEATLEMLLDESDGESYFNGKTLPYLDNGGGSGIADIEGDDFGIKYTDGTIYADGANIDVYAITGMKVATGKGFVNVSQLTKGVYVIAVNNGQEVKTVKIAL